MRHDPTTCRIDRRWIEKGLLLYISGRLGSEQLEVVRTALDGGDVVAVELAEVELVDREVVELLRQAEAKGIELRSCPAYIREWIRNERESS